jgi:hypothetical protein
MMPVKSKVVVAGVGEGVSSRGTGELVGIGDGESNRGGGVELGRGAGVVGGRGEDSRGASAARVDGVDGDWQALRKERISSRQKKTRKRMPRSDGAALDRGRFVFSISRRGRDGKGAMLKGTPRCSEECMILRGFLG